MKSFQFDKYQGLGNDFVLLDVIAHPELLEIDPPMIQKLCDRHYGIGADGLLLFAPPKLNINSIRMIYFNADGGRAEICVNGIRCMALHAVRSGHEEQNNRFNIEINDEYAVTARVGDSNIVTVENLSSGIWDPAEIPVATADPVIEAELVFNGIKLIGTAVAVPNPHFVVWMKEGDRELLKREVLRIGPSVETSPLFPQGTNFELVVKESDDQVLMEVWERGVGRTLACGSGAIATVCSGVRSGRLSENRDVNVRMAGGDLTVAVGTTSTIKGSATHVFSGTFV